MSSGDAPTRDPRTALIDAMTQQGGLSTLLSEAIAERIGMHSTDLESLDILRRTGPVTAGRLAELTGLTTAGVTSLIDRLERLGYVRRERDPSDRRRVIVQPLIENAERELGSLYVDMSRNAAELIARYRDDEIALILDFTERMNDVLLAHLAKVRAMTTDDVQQGRTRGGRSDRTIE